MEKKEKVEVLLKNVASSTGEGPHWDEKTQSLLFVDICTGNIGKWNSLTNETTTFNMGDFATFIVPHKKGGAVCSVGKKIVHFESWDNPNNWKLLAEVDQGKKTRFNDGKCDPVGRLFAGTMGLETKPAVVDLEMGTLFSIDREGSLRTQVEKTTISNGLGWTKDTRKMFFVDSVPGYLYAYDYDISTGTITMSANKKDDILREFDEQLEGNPDGLAMDADDKIWIACYGAGKVHQIDPQNGKTLRTVNIPTKGTTSCCFGGKNYDELYVTSSCTGFSPERMAKDPLAGSIFKVTGLGVKGLPPVDYDGK